MELSNFDKQVILFSKGHFSKLDGFSIKDIVSFEYDLNIKSITQDMLLRVLVESLQRVSDFGLIKFSFREMFGDMFKNRLYSGGDGKTIVAEDIISFIVGRYSSIRVFNDDLTPRFDLGEVNPQMVEKFKTKDKKSI